MRADNLDIEPSIVPAHHTIRRLVRWPSGFMGIMPALVLLALFFFAPITGLLLRSVLEPEPGLGNYAQLFGTSLYARVFANTFKISALVTTLAVLIGFPVAWMLAIMPKRWGNLVFAILLLSMWTNLLARTYAWMVLLQRTGPINNLLEYLGFISQPLSMVNNMTGVVIGMVYIMLLLLIFHLYGVIKNIDPAILYVAAILRI